ncbi:MAG: iron uptake system protein EfeO [Nitrolancea sp.]
MLPTFVIGLREGIEAALIVGIIAAYLRQRGRQDALRWVWIGVGLAAALCLAVGIALHTLERSLPHRQQEGLETIVAVVAIAFITYMVVWMRRHARGIKKTLEEDASSALARNTVSAFVAMAFFAVLREGFETAVFVLAVFQSANNTTAAGSGVILGLLLATILGYLLYRGGVRINLNRFFRVTGVVLVLVAAGLAASALHSAHEAGWFDALQTRALDLSWLVAPGSVRSSLLTGMLGLQPKPVVAEVAIWILYAIPFTLYVMWPARGRSGNSSGGRRVPSVTAAVVMTVTAFLLGACGSAGIGTPGARTTNDVNVVQIALTDAGCDPAEITTPAGPTKFQITNSSASAVTEFEVLDGTRILGEKENLTPGLNGSFSLDLKAGTYTLMCPNGTTAETGTLHVTGESAEASSTVPALAIDQAVQTYRQYLEDQTAILIDRTTDFVEAVKAGDIERSKTLYASARAPYERVEPVAESFGGLDPSIDAREGDVPDENWTGFHRIEKALWSDNSLEGMAPIADKLLIDVTQLHGLVRNAILDPAEIANGSVELLNEVSASKITGEEERYSHVDLVDFQANLDGSYAGFNAVKPILTIKNPDLASEIDDQFDAVYAGLQPYRTSDGFVTYTELSDSDTRQLSQSIDALAEPLSRVAEIVVTAGS